jgi:hypothetical protein
MNYFGKLINLHKIFSLYFYKLSRIAYKITYINAYINTLSFITEIANKINTYINA